MKNLIFILILLFVFSCENVTDSSNESEATANIIVENTGKAELIGNPDKLIIRMFNSAHDNHRKLIDLPDEGESTTVTMHVPPGNYNVGIMAYNRDSKNVSFVARTDEEQSFERGETKSVDLKNDLWNYKIDEDLTLSFSGEFTTGRNLDVIFTTESRRREIIENIRLTSTASGRFYFDSVDFEGRDAVHDVILDRKISGNLPFAEVEVQEEFVNDGFFGRVEFDVKSEWYDAFEENLYIIRSAPEDDAINLYDHMAESEVIFSQTN